MKFIRALLDALLPRRQTHERIITTSLEEVGRLMNPGVVATACGPIEALLPYREPRIRALVLETKFHNSGHASRLLGTVLGEYLASMAVDIQFQTTHIVLVPVPLSKKRHAERGYNQVEQICKAALPFLGPQFSLHLGLLKRVKDTAPQTTLNKQQRLHNMKDVFQVMEELHSEYLYVVIDDVSTTGATLTSATQTLRESGATQVIALALAH